MNRKYFFANILVFLLLNVISSANSKVETLVEKLFLRLEVRHKEILSIEENITHNRSELEKESLIRILEQKVRNFIKMDRQVSTVLDDMKDSKEKSKVFLYKKSMDRLDHYRTNIDQIQELYFRKPVVISPEVDIDTGNSNFEDFLSSWEQKKPMGSKEKRIHRAVIPAREKHYFDNARKAQKTPRDPGTYNEFLDKLHPQVPQFSREMVKAGDKPAVDKFHSRLTKEPRSPRVLVKGKDKNFASFYENLEKNIESQQKREEVHEVQEKGGSPFNIQKKYLADLQERDDQTPLEALMTDLNRMTEEKRSKVVNDAKKSTGESFQKFYDQLELSNSRREQALASVRRGAGADAEFQDFVNQAREAAKEEQRPKSQAVAKNPFTEFTEAMHNTKSKEGEVVRQSVHMAPGSPLNRQSFHNMFSSIPSSRHLEKQDDKEKAPARTPENPNRFRVILNTLKKDNAKKIEEAKYIPAKELNFQHQLMAVFPERKQTVRDGSDLSVVKSPTPGFEAFPQNMVDTGDRDKLDQKLAVGELAQHSRERKKPSPKKPKMDSLPDDQEPKSSTWNHSEGEAKGVKDKALDGETHALTDRYARLAQARLLRHGASLIPIAVETRDPKDRVYPDLPIHFEVELNPPNFLIGQILDSFTDSPWQKEVKTNNDGVAQIHLLLDLENKEINISREITTENDMTICKVMITPKY